MKTFLSIFWSNFFYLPSLKLVHFSLLVITSCNETSLDNLTTGLHTSARAGVRIGLAVCLSELEHQNIFITIDQAFVLVTKCHVVKYTCVIHETAVLTCSHVFEQKIECRVAKRNEEGLSN